MAITLSGGVITTFTSGAVNYKSHMFTASGELTVTGTGTQAVQLLLVGGGGGGSLGGGGETSTTTRGNGGGGGGLYYTASYSIGTTYPTWSVVVGAGGLGGLITSAAANGGATSFTGPGVAATMATGSTFGDGAFFQLTGSATGKFFVTSSATQTDAGGVYYIVSGSTADLTMTNIADKLNGLTSTFGIIALASGSQLQLTASAVGTAGNSFKYVSASFSKNFAGGINTTAFTGSYGGFGGQPQGGDGGSGGGGNPIGLAIFADSGSAGGLQGGRAGAGGGGATGAGSPAFSTWDSPFLIWSGGDGGAGKSYTLQDGTTKFYAAGGGGGGDVNIGPGAGGAGGSSIGGNGGSGAAGAGGNGTTNTGAGGGGGALSDQASNWGAGGNGGSGVVVITYTV